MCWRTRHCFSSAFCFANYIRFNYVRYFEPGGAGPALAVARDPRNIIAGLATSLVLVLIYWVAGIYSTTRLRGLAERCTKIAVINAAGLLIFIGALYLMHLDDYSRIVLALFYILGTAGIVIERIILRWVDRARRRKGLGLRHILLVGGGKSAALYLRALEHNPYYGFVVDGYLAGIEEPGLGVRYMGSYDALSARLDEVAVDEVVVALEADEIELLPHVFAACDKNGVRITMVPFYSDYLPARPTIDVLDECKLINVRQTPFDNLLNAAVKRGLDIIGSLILIILTSPVMLVTAIGVKLSSPGPVIFRQERIGLNKNALHDVQVPLDAGQCAAGDRLVHRLRPAQDPLRQLYPQVQPGRAAPVLQRAERGICPSSAAARGALPCGAF